MTHRDRLAAPKHYPVSRKETSYVHDMEGSRSQDNAVPLSIVLREMLGYADNESEAKNAVQENKVLRNGEQFSSIRQGVAVLDLVSFPEAEKSFRMMRSNDNLKLEPAENENHIAKITGKRDEGEGYLYELHNGENYYSKDDFDTGTTLIFDGENIEDSLEMREGAEVIAIDGGHAGKTGTLEKIEELGRRPDEVEVRGEKSFTTRANNLVVTEGFDL